MLIVIKKKEGIIEILKNTIILVSLYTERNAFYVTIYIISYMQCFPCI